MNLVGLTKPTLFFLLILCMLKWPPPNNSRLLIPLRDKEKDAWLKKDAAMILVLTIIFQIGQTIEHSFKCAKNIETLLFPIISSLIKHIKLKPHPLCQQISLTQFLLFIPKPPDTNYAPLITLYHTWIISYWTLYLSKN